MDLTCHGLTPQPQPMARPFLCSICIRLVYSFNVWVQPVHAINRKHLICCCYFEFCCTNPWTLEFVVLCNSVLLWSVAVCNIPCPFSLTQRPGKPQDATQDKDPILSLCPFPLCPARVYCYTEPLCTLLWLEHALRTS